ncbi:MAG TPA: hypothetical protein VK907_09285, partial [Phnomibacter sp.]|nr:hypothetical protein [Phnomibacter sp.]
MKTILTIPFLLLVMIAGAQTDQGDKLIGGTAGFQTGKNTNQVTIAPTFGIFAADNLAIGGALNFNSSKFGDVRSTTFGLGPFVRYYIGKADTKPFLVSEFDILSTSSKTGSTKISSNGFGFLLGLGFAAFINESVAVEGISGYNYSKFKDVDGSSGFALRFGFQVYLNRHS